MVQKRDQAKTTEVKTKKIHLVIGPSSVGKTTYIGNVFQENPDPVILACDIKSKEDLQDDCIIHYNSFRPFRNSADHMDSSFLDDPALKIILEEKDDLDVHFLVVDKSSLIKRIILRKEIENKFREFANNKYPSSRILNLVFSLDYSKFYEDWFAFFEEQGLPIRIVDSSVISCPELTGVEEAREVIASDRKQQYSEKEVREILDHHDFGYQKIDLPYNLSTAGKSRTSTLDKILERRLDNKSVLDIGCAYGYFCFEAEKRNAKEVVGTELKDERFIGANIIKEIIGSKVEFLKQDVVFDPIGRKFDIVLLLNVIHHLKYPMYALKVLSEMCKEKMIIEFPTVADTKFQSTLKYGIKDKKLPLIGVSLLSRRDQTFLFNDEAMRRILLDHDQLFRKVEFFESPFVKERRIAVCYK